MKAGWPELERELDTWAAAGRTATFWWRDDDAVAPTPRLDRLLDLAEGLGTPVAVAAIPACSEPALASRLAFQPLATPLQHGWRHRNHAPAGAKKAELGQHRPLEAVCADIALGCRRSRDLFGAGWLPCLVPPWNRIAPEVTERLPALGFTGLSAFGPRPRPTDGGLRHTNCHVDPMDWHGTRGFAGEEPALAAAIRHLRAKREKQADPDEPTGLLTHHLVMDDACWRFAEALVRRTAAGGGQWLSARAALATCLGSP